MENRAVRRGHFADFDDVVIQALAEHLQTYKWVDRDGRSVSQPYFENLDDSGVADEWYLSEVEH